MRVEVLGGIERRRRWSVDEKMRIIEETLAPGAVVAEIARRHGIAASLVFTWRRQARVASSPSTVAHLVPVRIVPAELVAEKAPSMEPPSTVPIRKRRGPIEIKLGDGKSIRVDENVDAEALGRVLDVLSRR
jgi:transposase